MFPKLPDWTWTYMHIGSLIICLEGTCLSKKYPPKHRQGSPYWVLVARLNLNIYASIYNIIANTFHRNTGNWMTNCRYSGPPTRPSRPSMHKAEAPVLPIVKANTSIRVQRAREKKKEEKERSRECTWVGQFAWLNLRLEWEIVWPWRQHRSKYLNNLQIVIVLARPLCHNWYGKPQVVSSYQSINIYASEWTSFLELRCTWR